MIAQHTGRCANCGGRIEQGDPINYYPATEGVKAESVHVDCPEQPRRPEQPRGAWPDATSRLVVADCEQCGACLSAIRSEGGLPPASPCCGSGWIPWDDRDQQRLRLVA